MNDFVNTLVAQGITAGQQKFKKFVSDQLDSLSGGATGRACTKSLIKILQDTQQNT